MKATGVCRVILLMGGVGLFSLACTNTYFDSVKKIVDENANGAAAAPAFTPSPGTYSSNQSVTISSATPGAVIFYTTDGSTPTGSSPVYSGPVLVAGPVATTIRAFARKAEYRDSLVVSATYTIAAVTPTMSPAGGRLGHSAKVTLSCATTGATIVYTLDGSSPTESGGVITHGTSYTVTGPFTLPYGNTIVRAMAFKAGMHDSAISTAGFTEPVFVYTASYSSNIVFTQQVNLTDGSLSPAVPTALPSVPQSLAADPLGRCLFVATATPAAYALSFTIDPSSGAPGPVSTQSGSNFVAAAVDRTGQLLYVSTGTGIVGYSISAGAISLTSSFPIASNTAGLAVDPVANYLYVALTIGQVLGFSISMVDGSLTAICTYTSILGTNSVAVDPTGKYLYAGSQGGGVVTAFTINADGTLAANGSVPAGYPIAVAIDPSGRFLYSASYADNTIYAFAINPGTGALTAVTPLPYSDSGTNPVSLSVEPSGRYLYVAHGTSSTVSIFHIDSLTGALTASGTYDLGVTQSCLTTTGVAQ